MLIFTNNMLFRDYNVLSDYLSCERRWDKVEISKLVHAVACCGRSVSILVAVACGYFTVIQCECAMQF